MYTKKERFYRTIGTNKFNVREPEIYTINVGYESTYTINGFNFTKVSRCLMLYA